jgi:chromosome partitioning protein
MQIWALANQKGGTGKTTTAINLAASLAALGKRVCLMDLDPQAHATLGLACHVEDEGSVARLFLDGAPLPSLCRPVPGGFHLVPSTLELAEFEQVAERTLGPERILERALIALDGRHDWVLLDCPPRADGVLCANAVRAATTTLLVVETGAFALQASLQARRLFETLAADLSRTLELRYLATRFDRRAALSREILVAMQARFGREMLDAVIHRDVALRDSAAYGVPVRRLDPASRGALDHDALARELLELTRAVRPHAPGRAAHRKPGHGCVSKGEGSPSGTLVPRSPSAHGSRLTVD